MTEKNIILTDIDGVVLNWETQFHYWMNCRGYNQVKNGVYNINDAYGISYEKSIEYLNSFNTSAYIIDLPPFRDSLSGIASLKERGYKFIGITAVGEDYYSKLLRKINLDNLFGKDTFVDLICVEKDKKPHIEKYSEESVCWIEDSPKNAEIGCQFGLKTFLMTHLHNEYYTNRNIHRVTNWKEICLNLK